MSDWVCREVPCRRRSRECRARASAHPQLANGIARGVAGIERARCGGVRAGREDQTHESRRNGGIGKGKLLVAAPFAWMSPRGKVSHLPGGLSSMSFTTSPCQYSTRKSVAKGSAHAIRIAFTRDTVPDRR